MKAGAKVLLFFENHYIYNFKFLYFCTISTKKTQYVT